MPLGERIIQPSHLGGEVIPSQSINPSCCGANVLIGVLQQLTCLLRHADDIFCDITEECQKIFDKSERIERKLRCIEEHVGHLDARAVRIQSNFSSELQSLSSVDHFPSKEAAVGDLSEFSRFENHHFAKHGFDCDLFTQENRPQCIRDQYNFCDCNPSHILRGADLYRKDGLCSSGLFRLWPIILLEHEIKTPDLNLPRKTQNVFNFDKKYKKLCVRLKASHVSEEHFDAGKGDKADSTYEGSFTETEVVQVDISGTGFCRMESFRKALAFIEYEDIKVKKKRRRTVSGIPENILHEIEMFEQKRKSTNGSDRVREYQFDDDLAEYDVQRDEEMAKYLDEIDAKIEERLEDERFTKEPKIMKFLPCRRSKSLPRCVKLGGVRAALDKKSVAGDSALPNGSCLTMSSLGSDGSGRSRSIRRGSIGKTIKALVRSASGSRLERAMKTVKPRPKSLELDALEINNPTNRLTLVKRQSLPDCVLNRSNSSVGLTKVGPGSYYNFGNESNTLPRRNVKRSDCLWQGVPKDWTTSVKLREISKRRSVCTDRNSSSGHWSGSNSNRHSLDSDLKTSQYSLGKDSGRDSPIPTENRCVTESTGYKGVDANTVTGDTDSVNENNCDTESWLKKLGPRAAGHEEVISSSAETLTSLTQLTKKNIMALDLMMSSPRKNPAVLDDGESSVYSVDQEGFYTSFHSDSGLKKSTATLVEGDIFPSNDTKSIAFMCSVESVVPNSGADKCLEIKKCSRKLNKVFPPSPPPRTISNSGSLSSVVCEGMQTYRSSSPGFMSRQDSTVSDTDQETISCRILTKSYISTTGIPPMCPHLSDEYSSIKKDRSCIKTNSPTNMFSKTGSLNEIMNQNLGKDISSIPMAEGTPEEKATLPRSPIRENDFDKYVTLPRQYSSKDKKLSTFCAKTNSWPRIKERKHCTKSPTKYGILKSKEKTLYDPNPPKSLNFAPVINLINPGAPNAVQMPLPSPSSTSSEEGGMVREKQSTLLNMADSESYKLTVPLMQELGNQEIAEVPMKYQPTIVVKPGGCSSCIGRKNSDINLANNLKLSSNNECCGTDTTDLASVSASAPTTYDVSSIKGATPTSTLRSNINTGYLDMQGGSFLHEELSGSIDSLESSQSLTLCNSMTYVSIASPSSSPNLSNLDVPIMNTPMGSFESLDDKSVFMEETTFLKATDQTKSFSISDNSIFDNPLTDPLENINPSCCTETVAITTKTTSLLNGTEFELCNKSPNTFTEPLSPPILSSAPYISSVNKRNLSYVADRQSCNAIFHPQGRSYPITRLCSDREKKSTRDREKTSYRGREQAFTIESDKPPTIGRDKSHRNMSSGSRNGSRKGSSVERIPRSNTTSVGIRNDKPLKGFPQFSSFQQGICNSRSVEPKTEPQRTQNYRPNRKSVPNVCAIVNMQNIPGIDSVCGDNSSFQRSDSYRVAMVNPNNSRNESYSTTMLESLSCQSLKHHGIRKPIQLANGAKKSVRIVQGGSNPPEYSKNPPAPVVVVDPSDFNRTDSYRVAVRSTHGVAPQEVIVGRNSSYRVAIDITEPVISDPRLEGLMTGHPGNPISGRDTRRMGITDVDQLKCVSSKNTDTKIDSSTVVRRRPKPDVDPISEIYNRDAQRASRRIAKNSSKRHSTSSTYIKFDPIFELGEEVGMESLKTGSNSSLKIVPEMLATANGYTKENLITNDLNGAKPCHEKSGSKLFGSIKSTIKSVSLTNSKSNRELDIEDDWRFSIV